MRRRALATCFFSCAVAKVIWGYAEDFLKIEIGSGYVSVASKWLCVEKFYVINVISTAVLRGLWLIRNDFVFNNQVWSDVKLILKRIWKLSMKWLIICKESKMTVMKRWLSFLELQIQEPMKILNA
jgi:hypothetical protein